MIQLEIKKGSYDNKFKLMTKEQRDGHLIMTMEKLRAINAKAQKLFERKPTLMELKLVEEEDKKLTDCGYYDVDYNQDLYGLAF